jgi:hypothetical protein
VRRTALFSLLLLLVITAGATVRLVGISHGDPQWIWHPDVSKQAVVARAVYKGADNPYPFPAGDFKRRLYPYGTAVLLGRALRAAEGAGLIAVTPGTFPENDRWLWSRRLRLFAVTTYLAAVALVLAALYPVLGILPGVITGLLLVLEPLNSRFSHYGMNDVPLSGILLLSWVCSASMAGGGWRAALCSILGGALLGTGFAVKYQALIALLFPVVAWALLLRVRQGGRAAVSLLLFTPAFLAGAAFASPLLSEDPLLFLEQFRQFMHWQANILDGQTIEGSRLLRNTLWLLRFLATSWLWIFLPGLVWAFRRARRGGEEITMQALLVSALAFSVTLPLILVFSRDLMRASDLLFAVPFLIILSAFMVLRDGGFFGRGLLPAAVAAGVILLFAVVSVRDSASFGREDTRLQARRWCRDEISPGARILRDSYVLPIGLEGVREEKKRFLVDGKTVGRITRGKYDYVISSSLAQDRFLDPLSPFSSRETRELYGTMTDSLAVVALFEDRRLPFNNPTVTIYGVSP